GQGVRWERVGGGAQRGGQDDGLADAGFGGVEKEGVEEPGADRHALAESPGSERRIVVCELDFPVHHPDERVDADGVHQWLGEGVVDEWVGALGSPRPAGGSPGGRRPWSRWPAGSALDPSGGRQIAWYRLPPWALVLCSRGGEADDVAELGFLVVREHAAVIGEEVPPWPGGHLPTSIGQVVN